MKLLCISDVHCRFDGFKVDRLPKADAVLISGDLTHNGFRNFDECLYACQWLKSLETKFKKGVHWIPGNHDMGFVASDKGLLIASGSDLSRSQRNRFPPSCHGVVNQLGHCLQVEENDVMGPKIQLTITGNPWTTCFDAPFLATRFAFMTADPSVDAEIWEKTPAANILLSHGPPLGYLDETAPVFDGKEWVPRHLGSPGLLGYIQRHNPYLVVCGHVHEAWGTAWIGSTYVVNCAKRAEVIDLSEVVCESIRRGGNRK